MKHKASKRILSILLAIVMLIGILPTAAIPAFAEEQPSVDSEGNMTEDEDFGDDFFANEDDIDVDDSFDDENGFDDYDNN